MSGFGNEFASEDPRCPGSLPEGQVIPQLLSPTWPINCTHEILSLVYCFIEQSTSVSIWPIC